MSGITGCCMVCGKFHATGHGGEALVLRYRDMTLLACPDCVPFAPKWERVECRMCGTSTTDLRYPVGSYWGDHQSEYVCEECRRARDHMSLHARIEKIRDTCFARHPNP
jgi:hypothetical protein